LELRQPSNRHLLLGQGSRLTALREVPNDPTCIFEYQSIDGRCCTIPPGAAGAASAGGWYLPTGDDFGNFPPEHPRYAGGHPFAFLDGHVKMLPFDATYVSPSNNMWATAQWNF
jgi:prepilin-type processing-associated H-X9-DG protein